MKYLGSDQLLQQQTESQAQAAKANLQASQRIQDSTQTTLAGIQQSQQQLAQLNTARLEAEARAAASRTGLAGFAEAAGKAVVAYKQVEDQQKENQRKQEQYQLEQLQQQQAIEAEQKLDELHNSYLQDNWNNGESNFRSQATELIAGYKLKPEDLGRLLRKTYEIGNSRQEELRKAREERFKVEENARLDRIKSGLTARVQTDAIRIKNLLPTEQMQPFFDSAMTTINAFLDDDNGLDFAQKLNAANEAFKVLDEATVDKRVDYEKYNSERRALAIWTTEVNKLNASGASQEEYESKFRELAILTGKDYADQMRTPNKLRQEQYDLIQQQYRIEELKRNERTRVLSQAVLGEIESKGLALNFILYPGTEGDWAVRLGKDSPAYQNAIRIKQLYEAAERDFSGLGIDRAQTRRAIAGLNRMKAGEYATYVRAIASKTSQNQALNPQEQAIANMLQQNPQLAALAQVVVSRGNQALTADEIKQVQGALNAEAAALDEQVRTELELFDAKQRDLLIKHNEILSVLGSPANLPNRESLMGVYSSVREQTTKALDAILQQAASQGSAVVEQYGSAPNFRSAGGQMGATYQQGKFSVAPKSKLQVQTQNADKGSAWITPVEAGVVARHSFNKGNMGGGFGAMRDGGARKHAGIDFPLSGGQKAMSVVSGQVLAIKNDPTGYGNYVDILGDNGYVYRYAHVAPLVTKGSRVYAGQAVATPNGSGAGGHHLHFEVREYGAYKRSPYGYDSALDPVSHLRELTKLAGTEVGNTTTAPRTQAQDTIRASVPFAKAPSNAFLLPSGGALHANMFQQIGKPIVPASSVFTAQRPMTSASNEYATSNSQLTYNLNDDLGYAYLRNNPQVREAMHKAAQQLRVPTSWIADIAAQETGNFAYATRVHPGSSNQNYGLFGFGKDSGVPNWTRLNPVQQVQALVTYFNKAGWQNHLKRTNGNVNLAQFWAITRMGTNWRKQILDGRNPETLKLNDTGKTFADELRLLGNHVGREYNVPGGTRSGRAKRNSGARRNLRSSTQQYLAANGTTDIFVRGGLS